VNLSTSKYSKSRNRLIILTVFSFVLPFFAFFPSSSANANNEFISYRVVSGDTLWDISQKYNTSIEQILIYNNDLKNDDILSIGQIIRIPRGNSSLSPEAGYFIHTVKKGETLWSIAQNYNLKVDSLLAVNNLANSQLISVGQEIKVPSSKSMVSTEDLSGQKIVQENKEVSNTNISNKPSEDLEPIIYVVKKGDSLWSIAQKYGVSAKVITEANNLKDEDLLTIGQKLEIPAIGGGVLEKGEEPEPVIITYTVVKGDNLWSIAQKYEVKMTSIISANNLKEISRLSVGQKLKIPVTNLDLAKAAGYNTPESTKEEDIIYYVKKGDSLWNISRQYKVKLEAILAVNNLSDASKISVGQRLIIPKASADYYNTPNFIWPIRGRISSPFGARKTSGGRQEFHSGIDISGSMGANIVAAQSGTVSFSGSMRGYGKVIILSHDNGYSTVYAHNSENLVKKGQYVKQGSVIAKLGRSGNATGPHLHFEIRYGNKPVNPSSYLK